MGKYKVSITEYLNTIIEVEAEDEVAAQEEVERMYYDQEIILNADDYVSTDFEVVE